MFKRFKVRLRTTRRLLANLPSDPKAIIHAVRKSRASVGLDTDEEAVKSEAEELLQSMPPEATQLVFLRDGKGIYLRERNVKGLLKEVAKVLGKRTYFEYIRHGMYVEEDRIYLKRDGKHVEKPDGTEARGISVVTMRGPRSALKEAEYLEPPVEIEFTLEIIPYVLRRMGGAEGLREMLEIGGKIGLCGDRSLGMGRFEVVEFRELR